MPNPEKKPLINSFNHPPEELKRLADELLQETGKKDADAKKVLTLIQQGAPLNEKTEEGCTPLILAAFHGHKEIAMTLIEHGARLDEVTRDHYDFIPHMHGRTTDMIDFGSSLRGLEGISVSCATALVTAVVKGHTEIARALIVSGAKKDGALAYARQSQQPDILKLFEEKRTEYPPFSPNQGNNRGPRP
jgi:ankyrin repeat protein